MRQRDIDSLGTKAAARGFTPKPRWPISAMDRAVIKRRARMKKEDDMRAASKGRLPKKTVAAAEVDMPRT